MATLPIPLEPFTDYLLDIEMVDLDAPENTAGERVWRVGFSTGRFPTIAAFANSFQLDRILHRFSQPGQLQAIGAEPWSGHPQGSQLDVAMSSAGLEPMGVPQAPRIIVFWETAGPTPQPAAVLVDASEPMWRSRKLPRDVGQPHPPHPTQIEMTPVEWLRLEQAVGGDPIVDKIIRAPGGQRALVTLKPGSRGKRLCLTLRHVAMIEPFLDGPSAVDQFHVIVDTRLGRAPWEEVD